MASQTFSGWLTINPASGTGQTNLSVAAPQDEYTGRSARTVTLKATDTATGTVNSTNNLSVTQNGKHASGDSGGFITVHKDSPSGNVAQTGGTAVFSGTGNIATLKLNLTGSNSWTGWTVTAASITAGGTTTNLDSSGLTALSGAGYAIPGDPGQNAAYTFSVTLTLPANAGSNARSITGTIGYTTTTAAMSVTQDGLSNSLWFSDGSGSGSSNITVVLNSDGSKKSGASNPRINTSPADLSWTITPTNT